MRGWFFTIAMGFGASAIAAPTTRPAASSGDAFPRNALLSFDVYPTAELPPPPRAESPIPVPQPQGNATAPLPPADLAGPAALSFAGWIAYRIRRRGGRI